jgi:hypothetical protein
MTETVERAVRARDVRTGDRLVTQTQTVGRSVFLYHPQGGHTTCDLDTPVKILRRVRVPVEPPGEARSVVHSMATPKGRQRPSELRQRGAL